MKRELNADVVRLYEEFRSHPQPLNRHYVMQAAQVVESVFPPRNADETFLVLVALNLLNAAVKLPWGERMVCYAFIKGYAACLFVHLTYWPITGVSIYLDQVEDVAYFRVKNVQVSFHHLPHYYEMKQALMWGREMVQEWDGLRLQCIAVELFLLANGLFPNFKRLESDESQLQNRMLHFKKPAIALPEVLPICHTAAKAHSVNRGRNASERHKWRSLVEALSMSIWQKNEHSFCLYRRRDRRRMPVMRYTGENYNELVTYLQNKRRLPHVRPERTMQIGKYYHVSGGMRIKSVRKSARLSFLTHNNYLIRGKNYYNLCVTYGIARYLAALFPDLLFANILSYNRYHNKHRRLYNHRRLMKVPLRSQARRLKVWMVHDRHQVLTQFSPEVLPKKLIDDFFEAEDYYQEFEITTKCGLHGIYAYRRHHLLPPIYAKIIIFNYVAQVMRTDGMWAIYSLKSEVFCTDFIYNRIWFDSKKFAILGKIGDCIVKIHDFFSHTGKNVGKNDYLCGLND